MATLAQVERNALCDLLDETGPDAATLCEGWVTRDLAAHLLIRERRPDAVLGYFVGPLGERTKRIERGYADRPWPEVVRLLRDGPPTLSMFGPPPLDRAMNAIEFFVHHEDVRRSRDGWRARALSRRYQHELWLRLRRMARLLLRNAPVGVAMRSLDGAFFRAKPGTSYVTLSGQPAELLLYAFGRTAHADVELLGEAADVARLRETELGF